MLYSSTETTKKVSPVNGSIFIRNMTKIKSFTIDVVKSGHDFNSVLPPHVTNEAGSVGMA